VKDRVLLVDDDRNLLAAMQRSLYRRFDLVTADSGFAGIAALQKQGPFAVVVSDLRMPKMDGIQFLSIARQIAPDTVRVMLTGYAELQTAIDAINEGSIFRFLTKPCLPEDFYRVLEAAVEQYRLVISERELLEKTLQGSIKVLMDILSMVSPFAFDQASRLRHLARRLGVRLKVERLWEVELAAMLSQIGHVTVPQTILEKRYKGQQLSDEETKVFYSHPQAARDLLKNIPRLEGIAEAIAYQCKLFSGGGFPPDGRKGKAIPLIARILKVVLDCDALVQTGKTITQAVAVMRSHEDWYDPAVLGALEAEGLEAEEGFIVRTVSLDELLPGMVLAEEITDGQGVVLVPKRYEISEVLKTRLLNFARFGTVSQPIKVLEPVRGKTEA